MMHQLSFALRAWRGSRTSPTGNGVWLGARSTEPSDPRGRASPEAAQPETVTPTPQNPLRSQPIIHDFLQDRQSVARECYEPAAAGSPPCRHILECRKICLDVTQF